MNKEQEYASNSDDSDEDFCLSKDVSGEEDERDSSESDCVDEDIYAAVNKKQTKAAYGQNIDNLNKKRIETASETFTRSTRQTEQKHNIRESAEKDELESDEDAEKSRSDALWADFLGEVAASTEPASKLKETPLPAKEAESINSLSPVAKQKVTEILDFAGEEVRVTKTVICLDSTPKSSITENLEEKLSLVPRAFVASKRTANNRGGLNSLVNQLGKKKKMSVLEKSQNDWKSFKSEEGIDEDLRTHNKGKNGFLERQDFLQRTDLRQFEIEKSMRQTRRQN